MPHIDAFDTEYAPPQILGLSQLANMVAGWWDINNPPAPQEIVDAAKLAQRAQAAYLGAEYDVPPAPPANSAPASTEMEDEIAAEKGDISQPGGVQQDSADAFTAVVEDEAKADIPQEP